MFNFKLPIGAVFQSILFGKNLKKKREGEEERNLVGSFAT